MKLFLARHGEYENPEGVVPYRLSGFPLTPLGKEMAIQQASQLASFKIRDIFTSPVERCLETATIIGKSLKLHPNPRTELIETGTPLQGMTKAAITQLSPNYPYDVPEHIEGGGESPEDIFTRLSKFVDSLRSMSRSSSHLIVSHGDPIHIFLTQTLTGSIPHLASEYFSGKVRYIPMGGLVLLNYGKSGSPQYTELI